MSGRAISGKESGRTRAKLDQGSKASRSGRAGARAKERLQGKRSDKMPKRYLNAADST
jgi:hypothetical protein